MFLIPWVGFLLGLGVASKPCDCADDRVPAQRPQAVLPQVTGTLVGGAANLVQANDPLSECEARGEQNPCMSGEHRAPLPSDPLPMKQLVTRTLLSLYFFAGDTAYTERQAEGVWPVFSLNHLQFFNDWQSLLDTRATALAPQSTQLDKAALQRLTGRDVLRCPLGGRVSARSQDGVPVGSLNEGDRFQVGEYQCNTPQLKSISGKEVGGAANVQLTDIGAGEPGAITLRNQVGFKRDFSALSFRTSQTLQQWNWWPQQKSLLGDMNAFTYCVTDAGAASDTVESNCRRLGVTLNRIRLERNLAVKGMPLSGPVQFSMLIQSGVTQQGVARSERFEVAAYDLNKVGLKDWSFSGAMVITGRLGDTLALDFQNSKVQFRRVSTTDGAVIEGQYSLDELFSTRAVLKAFSG